MKKYIGLVLTAVMAFSMAGCTSSDNADNNDTETTILQAQTPEDGEEIAVMTTNKGVIKLRFFPDEAPKAVENFITHAKEGYYDGVIFHRVIDEFMIQAGDPTGTGTGGESIWGEDFEDEISPDLHFYRGALAMANKGENTNGSQFFIVQNKTADSQVLDTIRQARDENPELGITLAVTDSHFYTLGELFPDEVLDYYAENGGTPQLEYVFGSPYTIFGQVIEGLDVVDEIAAAEVDETRPVEDIIIEKIEFEIYGAEE